MRKFHVFTLICILSGFAAIACQRDQGVQAGNDYQPRDSKSVKKSRARPRYASQDANGPDAYGELIGVDMANKTVAIRIDNGMEQTFKFDDLTTVHGLNKLQSLAGREGSEMVITWADLGDGAKLATNIEVTQLVTSTRKPARVKAKRR